MCCRAECSRSLKVSDATDIDGHANRDYASRGHISKLMELFFRIAGKQDSTILSAFLKDII